MSHEVTAQIGQLARLLNLLDPGFWATLDASADGPSTEDARARRVLADACIAIDRLTNNAIAHFNATVPTIFYGLAPARSFVKARPSGHGLPQLAKSTHAIADQPGLALLPAPSNPAVERWQRMTPQEHEPRPESKPIMSPAGLTASHAELVVRPSSDYEAFLAKQISPQTRQAYARDMRHFLDTVGLTEPDELLTVGPEMLIAYRNAQIESGAAPATIARRLSTLRSFFGMLVTLGRLQKNPADPKLVRSPRVEREGKTPGIEPHEARKILKAPDTSKLIGKRDRAILAVGLYMGLRRQEIAGLNLSDVREERGHHVMEVRGKGGKTRVLPIPPTAYSAVNDFLTAAGRTGASDDGALFPSMGQGAGEGWRLSGRDVWNIVRKYADQAGVNRAISPHSMRVAAITSALDHGAPIHRVQIMAGHADPRTTTRYYRQGEDLDESATYAVRY